MYENLIETLRFCAKDGDCHKCPVEWDCTGTMGEGLYAKAADAIEELQRRRTGVWITPRKNLCKCPVCGTAYNHPVDWTLDNFCSECGAKLEGRTEMRKIDACPYCGTEEAYVESYEHHLGATRYRVCCPKCGVYLDSGYWQTADSAIAAWNTRSNNMWWLPVSKQHPFAEYGEGKPVMTIDTMGVMRVAEWDGGNWISPNGDVIETAGKFPITHWMPLPEPPKEEA